MLSVVYPHNTTIGGDSVSLVSTPDGTVRCVNSTGPAAAAVSRAALAGRHGDRLPIYGTDTITVPGAVAAWAAIRDLGSELTWRQMLSDAIGVASSGVPVSPSLARALTAEPLAPRDPDLAAIFYPEGEPLAAGDVLRQPALSATLEAIAEYGASSLYDGEVGAALVAGLRAKGSQLTREDLAAFSPEIVDPISVDFAGFTVSTSPPNTQGVLLLRALRALATTSPDEALLRSAGDLARILDAGNLIRETLIADPRFEKVDVDEILTISADPVHPLLPREPTPVAKGDTVGIAAMDSDGYAISLIQSVFHSLGSRVVEPTTGMLLQNRGTSFSLDPHSPNVIAPRKRPAHTLMPVLVSREGKVEWVNATMGGKAQPQIHTQLFLREVTGADAAEVVSAPRFLVGGIVNGDTPDTVYVESDFQRTGLESIGRTGMPMIEVSPHDESLGHSNVVHALSDGSFAAASDPRSDGSAWTGNAPRPTGS